MSKFWTCLWKKNPETRESRVCQYQTETLKTERTDVLEDDWMVAISSAEHVRENLSLLSNVIDKEVF